MEIPVPGERDKIRVSFLEDAVTKAMVTDEASQPTLQQKPKKTENMDGLDREIRAEIDDMNTLLEDPLAYESEMIAAQLVGVGNESEDRGTK